MAVANDCRMTRCRACVRKLSEKTFKLSSKAEAISCCVLVHSRSAKASETPSRLAKSTMLSISMVVYFLRLRCRLSTTIQPDTPPTFKSPKHQI
jgi:hypothetical protein